MSKKNLITSVLLIGTFIVLLVATFFLPEKIPFHFDANGEAGKQIFYSVAYTSSIFDFSSIYSQEKINTVTFRKEIVINDYCI